MAVRELPRRRWWRRGGVWIMNQGNVLRRLLRSLESPACIVGKRLVASAGASGLWAHRR